MGLPELRATAPCVSPFRSFRIAPDSATGVPLSATSTQCRRIQGSLAVSIVIYSSPVFALRLRRICILHERRTARAAPPRGYPRVIAARYHAEFEQQVRD